MSDVDVLSHPLVVGLVLLIAGSALGSVAAVLLRLRTLERGQERLEAKLDATRTDLVDHMADELRIRQEEHDERITRQGELDQALGRVHERIDAQLATIPALVASAVGEAVSTAITATTNNRSNR